MNKEKEVYIKGYRFRGKTPITKPKNKIQDRANLVGKRFGRGVVIELIGNAGTGNKYWGLLCDCGTKYIANSRELREGHTNSCGCIHTEWLKKAIHLNGGGLNKLPVGEASRNELYASYKKSAFSRGYEFNLSIEEFEELVSGNCVYCGTAPDKERKPNKGVNGGFKYTGIDRIDSSKGYVKGNVVSCCWTCNRAKGTMSINEFEQWLNRMIDFRSPQVCTEDK